MAQGLLPLQQIDDFVDIESGAAWLSFVLDGQLQKWIAKVNDDWVDPSILSRFAKLLESRATARCFTYVDLKGQDCLIGCVTKGERAWLSANTGLTFEWL